MDTSRKWVFRFSMLVAVVLLFAGGTAAAQDSALEFDADSVLALGSQPVVASVFNNGPRSIDSLSVSARLDPPATTPDASGQDVPLQIDIGGGFGPVDPKLTLLAGQRLRVILTAPRDAAAGAAGWLTVKGRTPSGVVVARRPIAVLSISPAVTTWKVTSVQWAPVWRAHRGDEVGARLPLASSCAGEIGPSGYIVDGDQVIAISSTCSGGKLELHADQFPGPGTYSGKLDVGAKTVDLEVRRTMAVVWPILMILLGVLLALWTQGQLDSGARVAQRLAMGRLRRQARKADVKYAQKADGTPWEPYELEGPVRAATEGLSLDLDKLGEDLPRVIRWLPWPDGYMAEERKAISTRLSALDQLVGDWPSLPDDFAAAHQGLTQRPQAAEYAPNLVARALIVLGAAGGPFDAKELETRRDEARALPQALGLIDEFVRIRDYLAQFPDSPPSEWGTGDADALVRARQYARQAGATLAAATDATLVKPQIGPVLERASHLSSRIPPPGASVASGVGVPRPEAAGDGGALGVPVVSIGRIIEASRARAVAAGPAAAIFLSLAVGVLIGLPTLYNGKAWGTPADYAAALVWGYVASTITTPILGLVKQLGARPRDTPVPSGK